MIVSKNAPTSHKLNVEIMQHEVEALKRFTKNVNAQDLSDNYGSWQDCEIVTTLLDLVVQRCA